MTLSPIPSFQADLQALIHGHCTGSKELEMVFNLFREASAIAAWEGLIQKHLHVNVRYASVFTHIRPFVNFNFGGNAHKCELGDILLVFSNHRTRIRRAIFLQTKTFREGLPKTSDPQWLLYEQWPTVTYSLNKKLQSRSIANETYRNRGQFLMLQQKGPLEISPPAPGSLVPFNPVCEKMIADWPTVPISWNIPTQRHSEWSHLVWDLLSVTAKQPIPRGVTGAPAGTARGSVLHMLATASLSTTEAFGIGDGNDEVQVRSESDGRGFTTVMLEYGMRDE